MLYFDMIPSSNFHKPSKATTEPPSFVIVEFSDLSSRHLLPIMGLWDKLRAHKSALSTRILSLQPPSLHTSVHW